jgi:hypothetical protein
LQVVVVVDQEAHQQTPTELELEALEDFLSRLLF